MKTTEEMKRLFLIILMAIPLIGCRKVIFEDRIECPSWIYFDVRNAEYFASYEPVTIIVDRQPSGGRLSIESPTLQAIQDRSYFVEVKGTPAVKGYGVLGDTGVSLNQGDEWRIPIGCQSDTLYRFAYAATVEPESFTIPVKMIKEHTKVTVEFVGLETFTMAGGKCPFDIVIKGNTCGIDASTGIPVRGPFEYKPKETTIGLFQFVLPRQADEYLSLEVYGREHLYEKAGFLESYNLNKLLYDLGGVTWREVNLPDVHITVDYKQSVFNVTVDLWDTLELEYEN